MKLRGALFSAALCLGWGLPLAAEGAAPAPPPVHIESEQLEYRGQDKLAVYRGKVRATRGDWVLTCEQLSVFLGPQEDVERLLAEGRVEAVQGERWTQGDRASFDNRTGTLAMEGNPEAKIGKRHIRGERMVFLQRDERTEIEKPRAAGVDPQSGQALEVDADSVVLKQKENVAHWSGHVEVRRGRLRMRAPRMTTEYDAQGQVQRVVAEPKVELKDDGRWAEGKRAVYTQRTGQWVLTGNPRARQGEHWLKGSRVTFFSDRNTVEVEDAQSLIQPEKKP